MKQLLMLIGLISMSTSHIFGQITKGNFLVGGSFSYHQVTNNSDLLTEKVKQTNLSLDARIGYFPIDKLAVGLSPAYYRQHMKDQFSSTTISLGLGPFVRYYFLKKENRVNVLAQAGYQFSKNKAKYNGGNGGWIEKFNRLEVMAGPAIFLNSNVALECTVGWQHSTPSKNPYHATGDNVGFKIGFQIHLKKEKKGKVVNSTQASN